MNQNVTENLTLFRRMSDRRTVHDTPGLEVRCEDGKYGVVNRHGKTLIPFRYHSIYSVGVGLLALCRAGKFGLVRIMWDDAAGHYHFTVVLKCEYDAIMPAAENGRLLLLRRRNRYSFLGAFDRAPTGEFSGAAVVGSRFAEGYHSGFETGVLFDLVSGGAYPHEREMYHKYVGRSRDTDVLVAVSEEGVRLEFFGHSGLIRTTQWYDEILPLLCASPLRESAVHCFFVRLGERKLILDGQGNELCRRSSDIQFEVAVRDAFGKLAFSAHSGDAAWNEPPHPFDGSHMPVSVARRALDAAGHLPPMCIPAKPKIAAKRKGTIRVHASDLLRAPLHFHKDAWHRELHTEHPHKDAPHGEHHR